MRGTFRMCATCQQWTGPAPPKAKSGYERRSFPRSIPWMRGGGGHVLVDDAIDAPGGLRDVETEGPGDVLLDGAVGGRAIEPHAPAQEELGVEVAEQQIGVGHRGLAAAQVVAGGAGVGARAVGADLEEPHAVDARDRAAAGADLDHLDHRHADRQPRALLEAVGARHLELAPDKRHAVVDDARLGGRAAHVERQKLRLAALARGLGRGQGAGGGPGLDEAYRQTPGERRQRDAARGLHDVELAGNLPLGEPSLEVFQIAGHQRRHVDVGRRRRGALVLADLGHDLRRARDRHVRGDLADQRRQPSLVHRVHVGVQQADRDRLDALGDQLADDPARSVLVEGLPDLAIGQEPLAHFAAKPPRHEGRRRIDEEVVHVVAAFVADLERVAEALGGQERRPRALALDERVGRERRAVDDRPHGARGNRRLLEERADALLDRVRRIFRRGEDLAHARGPRRRVDDDEVGEGAADVDAQARRHGAQSTPPS